MKNKIVIIGCGNVGMSYAYSLINNNININELVLIDIDNKRAEGEAMDLSHCLPFSDNHTVIKAGNYDDCKDASIVCIAAGARQESGETRLDLIEKNSIIFKTIVASVMENNFDGIFLIATNPLDVMTKLTQIYSGLPHNRVIGSGTSLDTIRLRYYVGKKLDTNPSNVHAYVLGEHGDSEFIAWSTSVIGAEPLCHYFKEEAQKEIEEYVRNSAYEIIEKKGSTCYGIGIALTKITIAILNDENKIFTVSSYDPINDIYYGMPSVINNEGVRETTDIALTEEETEKLNRSIEVIKEAIESVRRK